MIHPLLRQVRLSEWPHVRRAVAAYRDAYRAHDWQHQSAAWHRLKAAEWDLNDCVEDAVCGLTFSGGFSRRMTIPMSTASQLGSENTTTL